MYLIKKTLNKFLLSPIEFVLLYLYFNFLRISNVFYVITNMQVFIQIKQSIVFFF